MINVEKQKVSVAWLSVISNSTLVILKLVIGIVIGSVSVISEAIHSAVDLVASLIALFSVKTSGKPADRDHPFGHGKIENISGAIEALLILLAAAWIIYEAIDKLFHPKPVALLGWGIGIMLFSSIVNIIVSQRLFRVGIATDSIALQADAWHLRTDVYTSAGVMMSLIMILIGNRFFPSFNFFWLDPVAAIVVALLIVHAGIKLIVTSMRDLIDERLPVREEKAIRHYIQSMYPQVHGFHKLRTRKAGHIRFIEFHMKVDPQMSVEDSHFLAETITKLIKKHFSDASISIHTEPCDGQCDGGKCSDGCFLTNATGYSETLTNR